MYKYLKIENKLKIRKHFISENENKNKNIFFKATGTKREKWLEIIYWRDKNA